MERETAAGLPPRTDEAKAFYEKYRPKYSIVQREPDEDTFAFWGSEMTDAEALEKFKGGNKSNDKKK